MPLLRLLSQLLKSLPNRRWRCHLTQQVCNIFPALGQQVRIKILPMSGLKALNCFSLLIKPNSVTGSLQFHGIHIRCLLLQLSVLRQCRIQFSSIFSSCWFNVSREDSMDAICCLILSIP